MSTAKKLHALRGDEPSVVVEPAPVPARPAREALKEAPRVEPLVPPNARQEQSAPAYGARAEQAQVHYQLQDRRRLSIPERLAEGRGFWRGAVVGGMMGLGLGVAGAGVTFTMWAPLIMNSVRDAILLQNVLHDNGGAPSNSSGNIPGQ